MSELTTVLIVFFILPIMFFRSMMKRYSDTGDPNDGLFKLGKNIFHKAKEQGVTDKVAKSIFTKLFGK